jgi:hypothetical protein
MDTERKIALGRRMSYRRYREYSQPFRVLLALTNIVVWVYFFGIPFFPKAVPHLSDIQPIIQFFVKGLQQ